MSHTSNKTKRKRKKKSNPKLACVFMSAPRLTITHTTWDPMGETSIDSVLNRPGNMDASTQEPLVLQHQRETHRTTQAAEIHISVSCGGEDGYRYWRCTNVRVVSNARIVEFYSQAQLPAAAARCPKSVQYISTSRGATSLEELPDGHKIYICELDMQQQQQQQQQVMILKFFSLAPKSRNRTLFLYNIGIDGIQILQQQCVSNPTDQDHSSSASLFGMGAMLMGIMSQGMQRMMLESDSDSDSDPSSSSSSSTTTEENDDDDDDDDTEIEYDDDSDESDDSTDGHLHFKT